MIKPLPAKIVDNKLELDLNSSKVTLSRMDVLRLRITLNAFINGELEEETEEEE